ncbi:MAG TPA: hypothetical protein VGG64_11685 [Pirellulales bacterium]
MTIALPGCGPTHTPMHGQVTLDGQPLDEAAILFVPLDKGRKKTGAGVVQGSYELKAEDGLLPGKYRVEVADNPPLTGSHDTTGNKSATAVKRRVIPEKYARESPLLVEVDGQSGSASREYNCDLKSGR